MTSIMKQGDNHNKNAYTINRIQPLLKIMPLILSIVIGVKWNEVMVNVVATYGWPWVHIVNPSGLMQYNMGL